MTHNTKLKTEQVLDWGNLSIMLCWQSLDGRLCIEYHGYEDKEWKTRYETLKRLGRTPQIYLKITEETQFTEEIIEE